MSVRQLTSDLASATRAADFVQLCRVYAAIRGDILLAANLAEERGQANISTIFRSAVAAGSLSDPDFASQIAPYRDLISSYLDSLRNASCFDRMLPSMRQAPLRSRAVIASVGATASTVAEGGVKLLSFLSLSGSVLEPIKTVSIVAATNELWRTADSGAAALFTRELRAAIGAETDAEFIRRLTTGISPISSSGSTVTAFRQDLAAALASLSTGADSTIFLIISPTVAKQLAVSVDESGPSAFPQMGVLGGTICGVTVLVSDGVATTTLVLVDANQILAANDTITLDFSSESDLQFTAPGDSPVTAITVMQSLFAHSMTALKVERWWACEALRSGAVAVVTDAVYGSGNSP